MSKVGDKLFKALKCKKHNYIKLMVLTPACKNIPWGPKRCLNLANRDFKAQIYKKKKKKKNSF